MRCAIEISVRDGENGNAPEQRITITLNRACPLDAVEEYASECAYRAAGLFGHVDPLVTWRVYCDGALVESCRL
jgi:hypothetical protein